MTQTYRPTHRHRDERGWKFAPSPRPDTVVPDADLLEEWTLWQRGSARRSENTIARRAPLVERFAREIGVSPLSACHRDINRWFVANPQWGDSAVANYHAALASWFSWLQFMGYRDDNPMTKLGPPPKARREPRPITDAELLRMLNADIRHKTRVKIMLGAFQGFRTHEIAKFKGEDIDLAQNTVFVLGKGRKPCTLPLHPRVRAIAVTMPASGYWFPPRSDSERNYRGEPHISREAVGATIGKVMRRLGVRGTPHSLRHWYATSLLRNGADIRTVQTLMRHESINSTMIYTKVFKESQIEALNTLDPWAREQANLAAELAVPLVPPPTEDGYQQ